MATRPASPASGPTAPPNTSGSAKPTTLELNPKDADARGLKNDDIVRAYNDRGEFKCKVRVNNAIRPGSSRIYEGQWAKYMEEGPVQNLTNDNRNKRSIWLNAAPVAPFNDTLVQVEKA